MNAALLLIDWVNPMTFDGAEPLMPHALAAADRVSLLRHRAHVAGVPVIYVNDNYGLWHLGFRELIEHFQAEGAPGTALIERLAPDHHRDHFVLKPMHSAFFGTSLDVLLALKEARRLILTGLQGNICVLFTANDAYMRGYDVVVPSDCIASQSVEENRHALRQMEKVNKADTRPSAQLTFLSNGR
jgi:nicotinamidase-related amidase